MAVRASAVLLVVFASLSMRLTASRELYVEKDKHMTWYEAHAACAKMGYRGLATALDANQEREVIEAFSRAAPWDNYFWVGMTDLGQKRKYVWFTTGQEANYLNWEPNQPGATEGEDCIAFKKLDQNRWGWNDDHCDNPRAKFVCER